MSNMDETEQLHPPAQCQGSQLIASLHETRSQLSHPTQSTLAWHTEV